MRHHTIVSLVLFLLVISVSRLPAQPPPVMEPGGRGLWLILQLVDEVRLQRIGEGTQLTLRRRVVSRVGSMAGRDGDG